MSHTIKLNGLVIFVSHVSDELREDSAWMNTQGMKALAAIVTFDGGSHENVCGLGLAVCDPLVVGVGLLEVDVVETHGSEAVAG